MNTDVNPGVRDHRGDPIEQRSEPAKRLRKKKGRSKDVDRMGRGKRIGRIAVGQQANIGKDAAGANPPYPFLEQVAGKLVGDTQGKPDKDQKNKPCFLLPDQNPNPQGKENAGKILKIGHEGHEPIEKEILPPPIDELEKSNIRGLKKRSHEPYQRRLVAQKDYLLREQEAQEIMGDIL